MTRHPGRRLLSALLPDHHRRVVLADLDDEYARVRAVRSERAAAWWYWRQVIASVPGAIEMRLRSRQGQASRSLATRALTDLAQDARHALRQMRRAPGFTAATVLMLAVGLGLVAGASTVANGILLRGWDVPDSGRVFRVAASAGRAPEGASLRDGLSYGAFTHVREQARSADYIAYMFHNYRLQRQQQLPPGVLGDYMYGLFVSDNFLDVLGIPLQVGSGFAGANPDHHVRVVLSDQAWRRHLQGDRDVVGRTIWLSGVPATIVGVTARGFGNLAERRVDALVEISGARQWPKRPAGEAVVTGTSCCVNVAGRRRDGSASAQVREELSVLTSQYRRSVGQPELSVTLQSTAPGAAPGVGAVLALIGAGALLVWCLTCANVGNLFLARGLRRQREVAVRLAIGASRTRLVRQFLTEGLVLAAIAGTAAYACAAGVPALMQQLDSNEVSQIFTPDRTVGLFAAGVTALTCLLVALAPALQATRVAATPGRAAAAFATRRFREVVLAVQIAIAAVLALSATLITRGVEQAADRRADFALGQTTAVAFALGDGTTLEPARRRAIQAGLRAAVSRDPGLALADTAPVSEDAGASSYVTVGDVNARFSAKVLTLSPRAFSVLDVPIIQGRVYADDPAAGEAVINETLAGRIAPGGSPIGTAVTLGFTNRVYTVVGVARDAHLISLGEVGPLIHVPPVGVSLGVVLARSSPDLARRMAALAAGIDPALTARATPLSESVQDTLTVARQAAATAGSLGAVATLLAIVGVFSVFSFLVEERRREIGIRLALGATKAQVRRALARACRRPVVAGLALGLVLSLVAGGLLQGYLFGLSPIDPASYGIVTLVLLAAAIAATAIPVRRALRVDPAITLKAE